MCHQDLALSSPTKSFPTSVAPPNTYQVSTCSISECESAPADMTQFGQYVQAFFAVDDPHSHTWEEQKLSRQCFEHPFAENTAYEHDYMCGIR